MLKESWYKHYGIARVFPFNPELKIGGLTYVVWYIVSDQCETWDLQIHTPRGGEQGQLFDT